MQPKLSSLIDDNGTNTLKMVGAQEEDSTIASALFDSATERIDIHIMSLKLPTPEDQSLMNTSVCVFPSDFGSWLAGEIEEKFKNRSIAFHTCTWYLLMDQSYKYADRSLSSRMLENMGKSAQGLISLLEKLLSPKQNENNDN